MALTPEDIVNKRFQSSKLLREGYDQDEVDDFLDEVVVEMRALVAERDSLKARLEAAEQNAGAEAPVVPAPVPAAAATVAETAPSTQDILEETQSSNNMLVLARRLHDEHVREGIEKRDALIAATALTHGMTVVTRNVDDFKPTGVPILNPWEPMQVD